MEQPSWNTFAENCVEWQKTVWSGKNCKRTIVPPWCVDGDHTVNHKNRMKRKPHTPDVLTDECITNAAGAAPERDSKRRARKKIEAKRTNWDNGTAAVQEENVQTDIFPEELFRFL